MERKAGSCWGKNVSPARFRGCCPQACWSRSSAFPRRAAFPVTRCPALRRSSWPRRRVALPQKPGPSSLRRPAPSRLPHRPKCHCRRSRSGSFPRWRSPRSPRMRFRSRWPTAAPSRVCPKPRRSPPPSMLRLKSPAKQRPRPPPTPRRARPIKARSGAISSVSGDPMSWGRGRPLSASRWRIAAR